MNPPLLTANNIGYIYPEADTSVFEDISFEIHEQECIAITGASGIGKSTLLHLIAGLISPSSGTIQCDTHVGIAFQKDNLYPRMNVENHLYFGLKNVNKTQEEKVHIVNETLAHIGLHQVRKHVPHQLSGGQKQRLSLGVILVYNAPIIVMDEPFSSLDIDTRNDMYSFLQHMHVSSNKTFVFVTHHQEDIDQLASKVFHLSHEGLDIISTE